MTTQSKIAFDEIQKHTHSIRERILNILGKVPTNCGDLEILLDLKHETCSARLSELYDEGLIKPHSAVDGQTEWATSLPHEIGQIKAARSREKYQRWLKSGEKFLQVMPEELKDAFKNQAA